MSYCRFSSYDFWCDVCCYHDVGGYWQIYVANRRHAFKGPLPDPVPLSPSDDDNWRAWWRAWCERHTKVGKMIDEADLVPIGLPADGASYQEPTPGAAADRLEELKRMGYHVPDYAIESLREEETE